MKVILINAVYGFGSTGQIVADISEYLDRNNIANLICYSEGNVSRPNAYKIGNKVDHEFHGLLSRISGKQGYFSKNATRMLLKKIDEFSPDIVHLHNLHSNYIYLPMIFNYLSEKEIATVITLHDCFFFTGKCIHYVLAGCDRWKRECGNCPQLKSGNKSWFFDRTTKILYDHKKWFSSLKSLGVIGVSNWITEEACKSILSNAKIIKTIYNWVDLEVFYPHKSKIRHRLDLHDQFIILGVAVSFSVAKGIEDFNKLAELLDDKFSVVLVGKVDRPISKKICHIERTVDISMLSDLYAEADVLCNLSKCETFGKVTAEALACGTPVIAYETTGCTELVPRECGFIEKVGDIQAVYCDIIKLVGNKEKYTKRCRKYAEKAFDKQKQLHETLELYKELGDSTNP